MENELLNYLRDLGAKLLSVFSESKEISEKQNEKLIETIADESIATRNLIKSLDKPDKKEDELEKVDFTPLIKSIEAEANFTRKTIEETTKAVTVLSKSTKDSTKEVSEATTSLKKALDSFKLTIPTFPPITFPPVDFKPLTEPFNKMFALVKEGFNKMLSRGTIEDPIYIKHLDHEGRPVDPNKVIAYGGAPSASSTGGGVENVGIKNASDVRINPATQETLQSVLVEVEAINSNTTGLATEATAILIKDSLDTVETKLQTLIDETHIEILKATIDLTATGNILTPTSGKKLKIFAIKFTLSADMTSVGFSFGAGAVYEKFSNPKGGGLYGNNMHPNYHLGATNEALKLTQVGTGTVTINVDYQEIT